MSTRFSITGPAFVAGLKKKTQGVIEVIPEAMSERSAMSGRMSQASNRVSSNNVQSEVFGVENDRLKSTMKILQQQHKVLNDDHAADYAKLQSENKMLKKEKLLLEQKT